MILKVFKVVWFLSLLGLFAVFFYVYASLPEIVTVQQEGAARLDISREGIFYGALAIISMVNALVFVVSRMYRVRNIDFAAWFYGLVITLNVFFVIALSYLSLFNSGERFQYERLGVIIYGSIILILGWALAWPVLALVKRFNSKPAV